MSLCYICSIEGYCQCGKQSVLVVSDIEIANPIWLRNARLFANSCRVGADSWKNFLVNSYRDYPGQILNTNGKKVDLNTEELEASGIREWFMDWCCTPPGPNVRIRFQVWERVRVVTSILKACYPKAAQGWSIPSSRVSRKQIARNHQLIQHRMIRLETYRKNALSATNHVTNATWDEFGG